MNCTKINLSLGCVLSPSCPRIELRTLGKVAEGEELTVAYVDFLSLSGDRQRALKQQYHFDCTCQHCSQHIKDDLMMAAEESNGNKVREGRHT